MRTLTLEDRRKIELMWRRNVSPVKIAAALEINQCTVYTELKRGQETDGAGDVVLDEFLASIPTADGPWDKEFHRVFCEVCEAENCDAENCPHNAERNNPAWWLVQGGRPDTGPFRGFGERCVPVAHVHRTTKPTGENCHQQAN